MGRCTRVPSTARPSRFATGRGMRPSLYSCANIRARIMLALERVVPAPGAHRKGTAGRKSREDLPPWTGPMHERISQDDPTRIPDLVSERPHPSGTRTRRGQRLAAFGIVAAAMLVPATAAVEHHLHPHATFVVAS